MKKRNRIIRTLIAGLAAMAMVAPLAACGVDNAYTTNTVDALPDPAYTLSADKPAWQSDTSKDNTLTWYVNADWWNKSFGQDLITKKIKEDLNVDIKFVTGDDTKLNTYFAGGDLPDVITVFDSTSRVAKAAKNWSYPLQDLAAKYDPYFMKVAKKETLDWFKLSDGKTHGYPSYSNTSEDYKSGMIHTSQAFVIRKDVLAAIGDQDFTTPEGFIAGMKAIKERFPDLVPFGFNDFSGGNSSLDTVLQNMLGVPTLSKDGTFYDRQMDDDYLTWLKTLRQVHEDGNISDDSFADDGDTFKEKESTGKYATMLVTGFVGQSAPLQQWASTDPDGQYVAIDGIRSTKGRKPTLSETGLSGWTVSYITKQCKNPAKAIQIFTYLLSDYGEMLVNYGIEGKTYTTNADGTVSWTPEANKIRLNDSEKWQKEYRMGEFVLFGHDRYKALNKDSFADAIKQFQEHNQQYLTPQYEIENIAPDAGTLEARSYSAITTKWSSTLVSLIRAGSDKQFDKIVDQYKTFLKNNDIDAINKVRNEKIKANEKLLGE
ncbi:sugar ABC transporter substrate-binding protein [Bifidobacterium ramosum]|uniref:Sugar ABC transporter substrate-binding protein n=1 Tax=Bifidobacterium ramosum TaxID=1798158 RepID=A0A6L4X2V8_9BIFI|nr:sugar ABC transporter substrate-binding protein [Bifidobacterium ramosum]KAB8289108.1 sugar ABC transporter substrate-binding protein [Bifidobacterium ramosum]NEG70821.1 sugar ABC transporter substrate-binding protein [Bifidobacterium ramosum]